MISFPSFYTKSINHCIPERNFGVELKKVEILPIYKNDGKLEKSNYRPISILSNVSKIYERSEADLGLLQHPRWSTL